MECVSSYLFTITACLLSLLVSQIHGQLELTKCCQRDEIYDMASRKCAKSRYSDMNSNYPMDPALAYYNSDVPEVQNVEDLFKKFQTPVCTNGAEERISVNEMTDHVHIDADVHDFIIDVEHHGILFVDDGMHFTQHTEYCIDRGFKAGKYLGTIAMFCHVPIEIECRTKTCINACCGLGMMYDIATHECVEPMISRSSAPLLNNSVKLRLLYEPNDLTIYEDSGARLDPRDTNLLMLFDAPKCMREHGYHAYNYTDETLHVYKTGEILINDKKFDPSRYCLVHIADDLNGHHKYQAKVCIEQENKQTNKGSLVSNFMKADLCTLIAVFVYIYH